MQKKHLKNLKNLEKNYTLKIFSNTAIEKVLEYFLRIEYCLSQKINNGRGTRNQIRNRNRK